MDAGGIAALFDTDWRATKLDPGFLSECVQRFASLQEPQLVFAIEIGAFHQPELFLPLIVPLLEDRRASVWTAVTRALDQTKSLDADTMRLIELHANRATIDMREWLPQWRAKVNV